MFLDDGGRGGTSYGRPVVSVHLPQGIPVLIATDGDPLVSPVGTVARLVVGLQENEVIKGQPLGNLTQKGLFVMTY